MKAWPCCSVLPLLLHLCLCPADFGIEAGMAKCDAHALQSPDIPDRGLRKYRLLHVERGSQLRCEIHNTELNRSSSKSCVILGRWSEGSCQSVNSFFPQSQRKIILCQRLHQCELLLCASKGLNISPSSSISALISKFPVFPFSPFKHCSFSTMQWIHRFCPFI